MKVEVTELPGNLVRLDLAGRLDIEGTQKAETIVSPIVTARQMRVIFNLSSVTFMASVGIRLLLSAALAQDGMGGKVVVAMPQGIVRAILETAGVDQLVPIYDSLEAAQAGLDFA